MAYPEWTDRPACEGLDTNDFFAEDMKGAQYENANHLKRICGGCPVKAQCLDYALHTVVDGWWANTTPRTRQILRKKLNIIPDQLIPRIERYGS